jgi:hypothetical protein
MITQAQACCNSVTDPAGGRAGPDFEASTKVVHRGPTARCGAGTPLNQPGSTAGCGAEKNNGLGEAISGSSPAVAERRSMMVSRPGPTALRIGSVAPS